MEDPGYPGALQTLRTTGAHIVPVPVDEDGQIAEMTLKFKRYDRQIQQLGQTEYPETQALLNVHGVGHIKGANLRADVRQQATIPAKSRRGLLCGLTSKKKSVWRSRPSARDHEGRQRLPAKSPLFLRSMIKLMSASPVSAG